MVSTPGDLRTTRLRRRLFFRRYQIRSLNLLYLRSNLTGIILVNIECQHRAYTTGCFESLYPSASMSFSRNPKKIQIRNDKLI
ncbi:hypothetical protein PILCRDRAFT_432490 [Piloderma croceum F 1598]|uniref:Uncharacterized protein n=1 Tax=Piloderma croceum (strain F 1598) TaxID=765440 RepID=A0A0C3FH34_PILCF|nr:hypothetical protein PILCRDRAFT_432490 [Piloderma croceum F 1598]